MRKRKNGRDRKAIVCRQFRQDNLKKKEGSRRNGKEECKHVCVAENIILGTDKKVCVRLLCIKLIVIFYYNNSLE